MASIMKYLTNGEISKEEMDDSEVVPIDLLQFKQTMDNKGVKMIGIKIDGLNVVFERTDL